MTGTGSLASPAQGGERMGGTDQGSRGWEHTLWFSLAQVGSQGVESGQAPTVGHSDSSFLEPQGPGTCFTTRAGDWGSGDQGSVGERSSLQLTPHSACGRELEGRPGPAVILLSPGDLSCRIKSPPLASARQCIHTHTLLLLIHAWKTVTAGHG